MRSCVQPSSRWLQPGRISAPQAEGRREQILGQLVAGSHRGRATGPAGCRDGRLIGRGRGDMFAVLFSCDSDYSEHFLHYKSIVSSYIADSSKRYD